MAEFVDVAGVNEIGPGDLKSVEVGGEDVCLANVAGTIFACAGRCGHMNMSLGIGSLNGRVVKCPLHGAEFDVTTGEVVKPNGENPFDPFLESHGLPRTRTRSIKIYAVRVDGDRVFVQL